MDEVFGDEDIACSGVPGAAKSSLICQEGFGLSTSSSELEETFQFLFAGQGFFGDLLGIAPHTRLA